MKKSKILVADDEKANIGLYKYNLGEQGYEIDTAENGKEAVSKAIKGLPDAILLDVMMPVMDGISACRLIKGNKLTKDTPIIIVSAKNSVKDIISGLKAGADEYLTKPFQIEELLLRVKSMIKLKKTHDELRRVNRDLEEEVRDKTEQLLEAARFEIIGRMASGLGHDLNNLLTSIFGYNNLAADNRDLAQIHDFMNKQRKALDLCQNFVNNLLNFSKVQRMKFRVFDPKEAVMTTIGILSGRLKNKFIKYKVDAEKALIYSDEGHFNQICLNFITNAIDAMDDDGRLTIRIRPDGDYTNVSFIDTGSGIKDADKEKIFDYLYTTKDYAKSTGIGLYTTKKIIEKLNGKIELKSKEGKGTTFTISLPKGDNKHS